MAVKNEISDELKYRIHLQLTNRVLRATALLLKDAHPSVSAEILTALDHGGVDDDLVVWAELVIDKAKGAG